MNVQREKNLHARTHTHSHIDGDRKLEYELQSHHCLHDKIDCGSLAGLRWLCRQHLLPLQANPLKYFGDVRQYDISKWIHVNILVRGPKAKQHL
jgi:hypothetical protein